MAFELPELPYAYDALDHISTKKLWKSTILSTITLM